jgi:DNA-binding winged helix-turn-helix (wHTH) protein
MADPGSVRPIRFGAFASDPSSRELRKGGTWLRVPDQSLAILAMLLDYSRNDGRLDDYPPMADN